MQSVARRIVVAISAASALLAMAFAPLLAAACAQTPTITNPTGEKVLDTFKTSAARERYAALYDAVLRQWPVSYEEVYVPTRFGRTHVIASGPRDAPPLVLLHPLTSAAPIWRPNVAALSERHRVYAVDVIGDHNLSEPTHSMRTRRDAADWFVDVLDGLDIERTSVAGNSLGGFFALNQLTLTPDRIDKTILISPVGIFPLKFDFYWHVALGMGLGMKKEMSDYFGGGVPWDPANDAWGELNSYGQSEGRNVNSADFGAIPDDEMRAIRKPVLLLIGDREAIYDPKKALARAMMLIPGLDAQIVPGANHTAALSKPADVNARILTFLQKTSP